MAGNNAIQILRSNTSTISKSNEVLLIGQPLYDTETRLLYVGNGENSASELMYSAGGIVASGVRATGGEARIFGSTVNITAASTLNINTPFGINISSSNGNINLNTKLYSIRPGTENSMAINCSEGFSLTAFVNSDSGMGAKPIIRFYAADSIRISGGDAANVLSRGGSVDILSDRTNIYGEYAHIQLSDSGINMNTDIGASIRINSAANINISAGTSAGTSVLDIGTNTIFIQAGNYPATSNITLSRNSGINISTNTGMLNMSSMSKFNIFGIGGCISAGASALTLSGGTILIGSTASNQVSVYSSFTNINGANVIINGSNSLQLKKGAYSYTFPNITGTVAMQNSLYHHGIQFQYSNSSNYLFVVYCDFIDSNPVAYTNATLFDALNKFTDENQVVQVSTHGYMRYTSSSNNSFSSILYLQSPRGNYVMVRHQPAIYRDSSNPSYLSGGTYYQWYAPYVTVNAARANFNMTDHVVQLL